MPEPTIILRAAGKRYGSGHESEQWAVRNVSLQVNSGELTVLMGPSGSGKTTLLSMIGGLLDCNEGSVGVCGTRLEDCDAQQRQQFRREKIAFMFQNYNLLSALTARENVEIALSLRGADAREADDLLESVGLADKCDAYPAELSGGQRQRVALARALAGNPPVLLADEPTAALDSEQGRSVMRLLSACARAQGRTVLVVTHDQRVREFSDRVIEMEDGRLFRVIRRLRRSIPEAVHAS